MPSRGSTRTFDVRLQDKLNSLSVSSRTCHVRLVQTTIQVYTQGGSSGLSIPLPAVRDSCSQHTGRGTGDHYMPQAKDKWLTAKKARAKPAANDP